MGIIIFEIKTEYLRAEIILENFFNSMYYNPFLVKNDITFFKDSILFIYLFNFKFTGVTSVGKII